MEFDQQKFIQLLDSIATENRLNKETIIEIIGKSFVNIWKKNYGEQHDVYFEYKDNKINMYRNVTKVDTITNHYLEVVGSPIGEIIRDPINLDFSRAMISDIITQIQKSITSTHKQQEYDEYVEQTGQLLQCTVKKTYIRSLIVSIGGFYEGIVPSENMVNTERFQQGDKILCRLKQVKYDIGNYQLIFDRKSTQFIELLLINFIPEIGSSQIVIENIVRDPGSSCKILISSSPSINAIGCCLGFHGQRKSQMESELKGEKLDFVLKLPSITQCITSCFKSKIAKIHHISQEDDMKYIVVTDDNMVGMLIGKNGQNIRLISRLLKVSIEIVGVTTFEERKISQKNKLILELIDLGMNAERAKELTEKYQDLSDGLNDPYLPEEDLQILQTYINNKLIIIHQVFIEKGGSKELLEIVKNLPTIVLLKLMNNNIFTIEDVSQFNSTQDFSLKTDIEQQFCAMIMSKNIW